MKARSPSIWGGPGGGEQERGYVSWRALRANIPALEGQIYLNTGVSGPSPVAAIDEERTWVRHLAENGPGRPDIMEAAREHVERVRALAAAFIGAGADELALTHSCSDGIAHVAAGLDWSPGDEVIISDLEHISGLLPWFDLARRRGVVVRHVPVDNGGLNMDDVAAAVSDRTKLFCMSHVAYNTGARLPVAQVAELARDRGALLLVDGAQGPGQLVVDVKSLGAHFYAVAGQKWLLGPEGTGALYVDADALPLLTPTRLGWASIVHDGAPPEQFRFKPGAARLEVAGKHVPSLAAWAMSIDCLQNVGPQDVEARIRALVGYAREKLGRVPGLRFITPEDETMWSGLLVFAVDGAPEDALVQHLWQEHRIVCRTIPQFGAVRISIHAYNTTDELDALVAAVDAFVRRDEIS